MNESNVNVKSKILEIVGKCHMRSSKMQVHCYMNIYFVI